MGWLVAGSSLAGSVPVDPAFGKRRRLRAEARPRMEGCREVCEKREGVGRGRGFAHPWCEQTKGMPIRQGVVVGKRARGAKHGGNGGRRHGVFLDEGEACLTSIPGSPLPAVRKERGMKANPCSRQAHGGEGTRRPTELSCRVLPPVGPDLRAGRAAGWPMAGRPEVGPYRPAAPCKRHFLHIDPAGRARLRPGRVRGTRPKRYRNVLPRGRDGARPSRKNR